MLQLKKKKKGGAVVGLDIEAGSIAAAEIASNGSVSVRAAAIEPLEAGVFREGEVDDPDGIVEALKSLFAEHKFSKRVRLGIGNQQVVVRTVRLPALEDHKEMEAAVRFQAQEQIPMPLDQAVLEHQVVGGVPSEEGSKPQVDVVVVAARRDMVHSFIEPLRSAGLEPAGVDLSAFGMIRALASVGGDAAQSSAAAAAGAQAGEADAHAGEDPNVEAAAQAGVVSATAGGAVLYCNIGDIMNLAVARDRACIFTRVATVGMEQIASRLAADRELSAAHAAQWIEHVGLEAQLEGIEGDPETVSAARRVLEEGVSGLVDELRLSLDYYGAQDAALPVSRIVLSGPGSAIPGLTSRMEAGLGLAISAARPPALASYDETTAARLTLPYGLALEA